MMFELVFIGVLALMLIVGLIKKIIVDSRPVDNPWPGIAKTVEEYFLSLENFNATKTITGCVGEYKVCFDESSEQVAYITKDGVVLFPFSDIIQVELKENGATVSRKSVSRTIGGAVAGGLIAGGAGAIIGGLSGPNVETKTISSLIVKVSLRNIQNPAVNIICFLDNDNPLSLLNTDFVNEIYSPAYDIVDTLNAIIATNNRKFSMPS